MKRIVLELSDTGLDAGISELLSFEKNLKPKLEEICKRLAEIGVEAASAHLAKEHGNTDANLNPLPVKTTNGYKITMSGADVYFVEFGTGNQADAHGFTPAVPVGWGTYSEQNAQVLVNSPERVWWYAGEKLEGTPAYMPMYYAGKAICESFLRVVHEVFNE